MNPDGYRASFKTVERSGIFYSSRPDWLRLGIHMTGTSAEAGARNVEAQVRAHVARHRRDPLIWC